MFTTLPPGEPAMAELCGDAGRATAGCADSGIDVGAVVGQVRALRAEVTQLEDQQVLGALSAVQRTLNALEGARAALVHEVARRQLHVGRGEASTAETLTSLTALRRSAARQIDRESAAIAEQTEVAEALCGGSITADQAAALASAELPESVRDELLTDAMRQNADQTRRKVRQAETAHRAESDEERHSRHRAARQASMWIDDDGMWNLLAKLDPEAGDQVKRLMERAVQREWRSEKDLPGSQQRTVPQRSADALVDLLCRPHGAAGAPPSRDSDSAHSQPAGSSKDELGLGPRTFNDPGSQMIVTVELATLRGGTAAAGVCACADEGKGHGLTDTGTELSPSVLRRIACDATIVPAVMGTRSEVLDVGRASRSIPPAIRRALIARDGGCVWPGCGVAPIGCVGHHLVHWANLGPTSLANLALLCHTHHNFLHQHDLGLLPPGDPRHRFGAVGFLDDASPPLTAREERSGRWTVTGLTAGCMTASEFLLPQRC